MKRMVSAPRQHGFTLPELLVASVVLIALLVGVYVLLVPQTYDAQARDAQRRLDLAMIVQAITAYEAENNELPASITEEMLVITSEENESDLCLDLVPAYLDDMPLDPLAGIKEPAGTNCANNETAYLAAYTVRRADGEIILAAPLSEGGKQITVSRNTQE